MITPKERRKKEKNQNFKKGKYTILRYSHIGIYICMLKFQPPMLNDEVCRMATDKQTHKHTIRHINIHTE